MVETAPPFASIADELDAFTRNRILIAHNAHFDYTFLKYAFQREGINFQRKLLCTLRLSRKIIPGLGSYALDNLCRTLQIEQRPVHRAESDAVAALELFNCLLRKDQEGVIEGFLKKKITESPHLLKDACPLAIRRLLFPAQGKISQRKSEAKSAGHFSNILHTIQHDADEPDSPHQSPPLWQ